METNRSRARVVFTASNSWFGRAIRWITSGTVSHVFVEFQVWGRPMVAESTVGGVRLVPAIRSRHNIVAEYECNFDTQHGILCLMDTLGTPYDYSGILVIAWWRILAEWFKVKGRRITWTTKAIKCSELVWYYMKCCGVLRETDSKKKLSRELTTPNDLLIVCQLWPELFIPVGEEITKKIFIEPKGMDNAS